MFKIYLELSTVLMEIIKKSNFIPASNSVKNKSTSIITPLDQLSWKISCNQESKFTRATRKVRGFDAGKKRKKSKIKYYMGKLKEWKESQVTRFFHSIFVCTHGWNKFNCFSISVISTSHFNRKKTFQA